jgi:hypothetical protein
MSKHRKRNTPNPLRRGILTLAALVPAGMLAAAGTASAQPEDTIECGEFQVVCADEIVEVGDVGPIAEDILDFNF